MIAIGQPPLRSDRYPVREAPLNEKNLLVSAFLFPLGCPSEQVVVRDIPGECGNGEIEAQEECDDE